MKIWVSNFTDPEVPVIASIGMNASKTSDKNAYIVYNVGFIDKVKSKILLIKYGGIAQCTCKTIYFLSSKYFTIVCDCTGKYVFSFLGNVMLSQ